MGGENSKHQAGPFAQVPGMNQQNPFPGQMEYGQEQNNQDGRSQGMFGRISQTLGFGSGTGGTGATQAEMQFIGEGTQPISDFAWKKKENKYLGMQSLTEREQKDTKDMKQRMHVDQYLSKFPESEKFLGFENDSNICYANSAIQVLYHCKIFREQVLQWKPFNKEKYYLINELHDLFKSMSTAKGNRGVMNHRRFIARFRAGNALFNNDEHHDSHEFLQGLIDEIHMNVHEDYRFYLRKKLQNKDYYKELQKYVQQLQSENTTNERKITTFVENYHKVSGGMKKDMDFGLNNNSNANDQELYYQMSREQIDQIISEKILPKFKTWVQKMFEGELAYITKCQRCERTSVKEETFMNLQIDIEKNVSLSYCLKKVSSKELLNLGEKYFCESCNTKQVATRQTMIKNRPKLLLIQLKRFLMNYQTMQNQKLSYRIPYPMQLHIEENQIFHNQNKGEDTDIQEEEKKQSQDPYFDMDYEINQLLHSENHSGYPHILKLDTKQACHVGSEKENHSYDLKGIVVHYGSGMQFGHYWSLAKSDGNNPKWIEFDDTKIRVVEDREIQMYYGSHCQENASWNSAYMLLYTSKDLNVDDEEQNQES